MVTEVPLGICSVFLQANIVYLNLGMILAQEIKFPTTSSHLPNIRTVGFLFEVTFTCLSTTTANTCTGNWSKCFKHLNSFSCHSSLIATFSVIAPGATTKSVFNFSVFVPIPSDDL